MKVVLAVRHQGPVPAFKNKKRAIMDLRSGRLRTLTEPKAKRWMEECIRSFELQFFSDIVINEGAILTAPYPHSLIASLLPQDDSRQWIPSLRVDVEEVPRGQEGAQIIIERIEPL